jgi:hypothetical protein
VVAYDEARGAFLDRPGRREAALGEHRTSCVAKELMRKFLARVADLIEGHARNFALVSSLCGLVTGIA